VMTTRPGRIKAVVDVPDFNVSSEEDVRSSSEFVSHRHEIWKLMRDEFAGPLSFQSREGGTLASGEQRPVASVARDHTLIDVPT
jgi:hypothetical protein